MRSSSELDEHLATTSQGNLDENGVTLAILAGGAGSRMGMAKASLTINGQSILDHLLDRIRWGGPAMLVIAPGTDLPPGAGPFGRVVRDAVAGQGPLRGVKTAIENSETELIVVATVDMPAVGRDQITWSIDQLRNTQHLLGVLCQRQVEKAFQIEPFPCAFRKAASPLIARELANDRRAMQVLLEHPEFRAVITPATWPQIVWTNLNTPEDLRRFEEHLRT